jgi:hypothetical protein
MGHKHYNFDTSNSFFKPVKNIAVLLYGQWRNGDVLVDYIHDFYYKHLDESINVDFFVCIKAYDQIQNSAHYTKIYNGQVINYDQDKIRHIENQINKFNTKKYKILTYEEDKHNIKTIFSRFYTALIQAQLMKKTYELENNIVYDLCFIQRPDVLVHPNDLIAHYVGFHNDLTFGSAMNLFRQGGFPGYYAIMETIRPWSFDGFSCQQDLFFGGTSIAMDLLIQNLYIYPTTENWPPDNNLVTYPARLHSVSHLSLAHSLQKSKIPVTGILGAPVYDPGSEKKSIDFSANHDEKLHNYTHKQAGQTVLRGHSDLTLDPYDFSTLTNWHKVWRSDF